MVENQLKITNSWSLFCTIFWFKIIENQQTEYVPTPKTPTPPSTKPIIPRNLCFVKLSSLIHGADPN